MTACYIKKLLGTINKFQIFKQIFHFSICVAERRSDDIMLKKTYFAIFAKLAGVMLAKQTWSRGRRPPTGGTPPHEPPTHTPLNGEWGCGIVL